MEAVIPEQTYVKPVNTKTRLRYLPDVLIEEREENPVQEIEVEKDYYEDGWHTGDRGINTADGKTL